MSKDGGPAFPRLSHGSIVPLDFDGYSELRLETIGGMSLRDYFAAQTLTNLRATSLIASDLEGLVRTAY